MRAALIGDVHGNMPALETVLNDAHARGCEAIWNIGDFVGYGPFPDEVVRRLRDEKAVSIIGNYDVNALQVKEKKAKKNAGKQLASQWAYDHLTQESRDYLASLPAEVRMEVEGKRILLTHGSPASDTEHLWPDTPVERFRELAKIAEADIAIFGHSHQAFARVEEGVWFINTGSVGRPDDGDPRACYAILELGAETIEVSHFRVEYDVEAVATAIRANGLPEAYARMMLEGRSLDFVEEEVQAEKAEMLKSAPAQQAGDDGKKAARQSVRLQTVLEIAEAAGYEATHSHQVTRLALDIFDQLGPLHQLGSKEKFYLQCAGLLHDIGWKEGWEDHNKTSQRMIEESQLFPFGKRGRLIIGCVARYHRGGVPRKKHKSFGKLSVKDQAMVSMLSAILRVADGLDRSHQSLASEVDCSIYPHQVRVRFMTQQPAEEDQRAAMKKGDLMEQVFERKLSVEWREK